MEGIKHKWNAATVAGHTCTHKNIDFCTHDNPWSDHSNSNDANAWSHHNNSNDAYMSIFLGKCTLYFFH